MPKYNQWRMQGGSGGGGGAGGGELKSPNVKM